MQVSVEVRGDGASGNGARRWIRGVPAGRLRVRVEPAERESARRRVRRAPWARVPGRRSGSHPPAAAGQNRAPRSAVRPRAAAAPRHHHWRVDRSTRPRSVRWTPIHSEFETRPVDSRCRARSGRTRQPAGWHPGSDTLLDRMQTRFHWPIASRPIRRRWRSGCGFPQTQGPRSTSVGSTCSAAELGSVG